MCRHIITGNDWQLPEVQQRYYPHFSPFINARIDRLRQQQGQNAGPLPETVSLIAAAAEPEPAKGAQSEAP